MKPDAHDIDQRLKILQVITKTVVHQENDLLVSALSTYRTDNVQWVLNIIQELFNEFQDALELQDYGHYLDER
jgi:hypothetical protein